MVFKYTNLFLFIFLIVNIQSISVANNGFELINFKTDDGGRIEASYFEGNKDLAVIFAHGAVFNKESWYFMAEKLQKQGISSLSIDFRGYGNSKKGNTDNKSLDILGAIDFLKNKGYKNITIVGGSMGGAAVLNALSIKTDPFIKKVVLLAPAGGNAIASSSIKKLFVVSKGERLFSRVNTIYNNSSQLKKLKIFPGTFHAQHMFKAEYSNELITLILDFIKTD